MYLTINGKFLDKKRPEAKKASIANIGEEDQKTEDSLTFEDLEDEITDVEITDSRISASFENKLGFFSVDIPIDTEDLISLLELAIKKFNKMKATFEGLK